jgi:hypothetical protein
MRQKQYTCCGMLALRQLLAYLAAGVLQHGRADNQTDRARNFVLPEVRGYHPMPTLLYLIATNGTRAIRLGIGISAPTENNFGNR